MMKKAEIPLLLSFADNEFDSPCDKTDGPLRYRVRGISTAAGREQASKAPTAREPWADDYSSACSTRLQGVAFALSYNLFTAISALVTAILTNEFLRSDSEE